MNRYTSDAANLQLDPDFFRAAVNFTAQRTGFAARLIEKDYFCTVLLEYLASTSEMLIFKGGTCLAKVHA
jgi:predicted nucleotidyltransferase component of viral defense system